jgi:tRNA (adenine22-N1)-methyltransferase
VALSKRLSFLASLLKPYDSVLDLGTDHGLLLKEALSKGYIQKGLASDIKPLPLKAAQKNLAGMNVSFYLSDGFSQIKADFDCVVIAGMGAKLIAQILSGCTLDITYILNPMDDEDTLRWFLQNNGFKIIDEYVLWDKFYYQIIIVRRGVMKLTKKELYLGRYLKKSSDYENFLLHNIHNLKAIIQQIGQGQSLAAIEKLKILKIYQDALNEVKNPAKID